MLFCYTDFPEMMCYVGYIIYELHLRMKEGAGSDMAKNEGQK